MAYHWPADTVFHELTLEVDDRTCWQCQHLRTVCCHRQRRFFTRAGPVQLVCKLCHCSNPACSEHQRTVSPEEETALVMPYWVLGWDVFCWLGHRRFARHWSVPQIRADLSDRFAIPLSVDAIEHYVRRYQLMLAARQQDPIAVAGAYRRATGLILTIDGLQPEKGHETLYVVRELTQKRVWFAETLLSSSAAEVQRLLARARTWVERLGLPVRCWISDKQDAFVTGIAAEFPGGPHRYCANHFLRDLAKPTLEADSHAKVQMRRKVRGLRDIERAVLKRRRGARTQVEGRQGVSETSIGADGAANASTANQRAAKAKVAGKQGVASAGGTETTKGRKAGDTEAAGQVVLDYCAVVRGILNDDQGGPLQPPGLRMAEALAEVRASLGRNLALNKPGRAHKLLARLAGCIDRGLAGVKEQQEQVKGQVRAIQEVAATLDASSGTLAVRKARYERLRRQYEKPGGEFCVHVSKLMGSFADGLFVRVQSRKGESLPSDNLDIERWFRKPKGHERRIHGHKHAGVRIVQQGPTLLLALDAHEAHSQPFTAGDLLPYRDAQPPPDQVEAMQRHKLMRKARTQKNDKSYSLS